MNYKIIQQNDNQTIIEIEINNEIMRSLIVAPADEFDNAVAEFIDAMVNPKIFTPSTIGE